MKPLSIYIHIPFCEQKCLYCDFVSFKKSEEARSLYAMKLIEEINHFDGTGYEVDSIFIGGGTPTTMNIADLQSIVEAVFKNFSCNIKEFTIEGNPNSYTKEKVEAYKKLGVTRLSVGVQSFDDKVLKGIGRVHNGKQAESCLKMLVDSGLDVNCDLMVGLAYQTIDIVKESVEKALNLGVNHIACYSLILEEGTPLYNLVKSGKVILPTEDETVDMYDLVKNTAQKFGLEQYEISNFGKPCLHNVGYWTMKEYVGFGLSAHSLIDNTRFYNTSDFERYLANDYGNVLKKKIANKTVVGTRNNSEKKNNLNCEYNIGKNYILEEKLSASEMAAEYAMLALRMNKGINIIEFKEKYGNKLFDELLKKINMDKKYYNITINNISIKPEYIYVSNSLIEKLI